VLAPPPADAAALEAARHHLLDGLACALETLHAGDCASLFGPSLPGMTMAGGARIPGTSLELDPVQAAFSLGLLLRWRGDTRFYPAAHWGHPRDCLGVLLAVFDYRARRALHAGATPPTVRDLLLASITAAQLQSRLELPAQAENVALRLRSACALVAGASLGASAPQLHAVLAECLLDGTAPPAAQRRWMVADAGSRGLWQALVVLRRGESELATQREAHALRAGDAAVHASVTDPAALQARLHAAVVAQFTPRQAARIAECLQEPQRLDTMRVSEFIARFVKNA
jgi:2-methylcitrate dehydratase